MAGNVGLAPQQVITSQSAINTAGGIDGGTARQYHSLFVVAGTGVSAGVVAIELSQDNVNWFAPATNTVTVAAPGVQALTVGPFPFEFARARISTAITGGTITAYVASA